MDAVVKEEKNMIESKKEVDDSVELIGPKVELFDEEDVKMEDIDDSYQNIIPYEYRDYKEQHDIELQPVDIKKSRVEKQGIECKKCGRWLAPNRKKDHAVVHTNLYRFECGAKSCGFRYWHRSPAVKHVRNNHNGNMKYVKEKRLTEEEKDELENMIEECFPGFGAILPPTYSYEEQEVKIEEDDHLHQQEKNMIKPKKEEDDSVGLKEPKVELIDEMDVKMEEIDEDGYKHIIPYEYRDYNEQHTEEERPYNKFRKPVQCQKCSKFVGVGCFADAKKHAVTHTKLKRFKCKQCNYGSWYRASVQKHVNRNSQYEKKPCSMQEIQLSEEDNLKWSKLARECFPSRIEAAERPPKIIRDRAKCKYTCLVCNKQVVELFSNPSAARRDHALQHTDVQLYKCIKKDCSFKTNNSHLIRNHHRNIHNLVFGLVPRAKVEITNEQELEIGRMVNQCFPELKED